MTKNIDVAINLFGKPYQTLITIASLLEHSGDHVDKIYLIEEIVQPHGDSIDVVLNNLFSDKIIHFKPPMYLGFWGDPTKLSNPDYRLSIRYQYAWENTNKDYIFICHNDCLFTKDILGGMLERMQSPLCVGVGQIGQCWNCPAYYANLCNGDKYESYKPSYQSVIDLIKKSNPSRTNVETINKSSPMPLPECRLNEFGCLVNIGLLRNIVFPKGDIKPFGLMGHDIGTDWFRELVLRGYRFINWYEGMEHGWIIHAGGHQLDSNEAKDDYYRIENIAKQYLIEHYPSISVR